MAKQSDCLLPVTIGGIKITKELLDALQDLKEDTCDTHFFTEQCLILSSIDIANYGLQRKLFLMLLNMFNVLKALDNGGKGGENEG
jgi:hypothetical protein